MKRRIAASAFAFVLTMGTVNLFADMTHEGGASINGPFVGTLGAGAAMISIIAGVDEFLGYSLRSVAGYVADKTGKYWLITFLGYSINLLAVPAMALAGNWQAAGALILAERMGRALRKPTVEAMLSYSTGKHGKGRVYALNTALDETGATFGPLLVALVLYLKVDFKGAYETPDSHSSPKCPSSNSHRRSIAHPTKHPHLRRSRVQKTKPAMDQQDYAFVPGVLDRCS
jgi:hypothetical protein